MTRYTFDPAPVLATYHGKTDEETAELLGVCPRTVLRWRHGTSRLTIRRADELAVHIGSHPSLLWPDDWWLR